MNNKRFCFIICTNSELMLDECLHYLNHLIIPQGYEIDLLTIQDAPSITAGYNSAMQASDAKYKIYMHQDVFILNKNFLQNLLDIFNADSQIGLIGMIGYENLSPDGIMWNGIQCGNIYRRKPKVVYPPLSEYMYSLKNDGYSYVAEVDGLLMATSQDLPWDTESITGWDFYDAFHSMNYLMNGYRIAVPNQTHPWCLHDDGFVLNLFHYNNYRQIFMEKYKNCLGKRYSDFPQYTDASQIRPL